MSFAKKVVVAVELDENLDTFASKLKEISFLKDSEIHFVNVFHMISYALGMGSVPLIYPLEADRQEIENSVLEKLKVFGQKAVPADFKGMIRTHCLFSENQKYGFADYVKQENPDLVIISTKTKHGFLEGSFANYVNKHTDVNLLLIKKAL